MNWREAYDALKTALEGAAPVVAHSLPVLDGIHAVMTIEKLAETYEGTFQDNPFSVVIEHPAASVFEQTTGGAWLKNAFTVIIVENPTQRETTALDPLTIPIELATAVIGQPGNPGAHNFSANADFYKYAGDSRGFLFHRFTFLMTTALPGTNLPSRPTPLPI